MSSKAVLIVCDGMGDRPVRGKTPLQIAETQNMDSISKEGINGLMDPISPGIVPGSDTSHLSLLGYDPHQYYRGRGPFEALGAGMELERGDVAFRANFATVDDNMNIIDRRAGRFGHEELAKVLNMNIEGVDILVRHTVEHRCALVFRGKGLSDKISDVDPHEEGKIRKCIPLDNSEEAKRTAEIMNKYIGMCHDILRDHPLNEGRKLPANIILPRGAGMYKDVERRFRFRSACIAGAALYKGVAKFVGMDVLDVEGTTGRFDTNLISKKRAALKALEKYDFVFIHVKGTDNVSHDGDLEKKIEMISRIDRELMDGFVDLDSYVIITADHSTPVSIRRHSSDPVPIAIKGEGVRIDDVSSFDELSAVRGGLGRIRGIDLMPIIADFMGYYEMYGV
ncbi:MAG: 2,3-bisphosphoglycerate-independent phosphoglycerate mutase [Candidatus Syntropharchaeia archaeon]